jgi:hypothetical protein
VKLAPALVLATLGQGGPRHAQPKLPHRRRGTKMGTLTWGQVRQRQMRETTQTLSGGSRESFDLASATAIHPEQRGAIFVNGNN